MKTIRWISIVLFAVLFWGLNPAFGKKAVVHHPSGILPTTHWNTFLGGEGVDLARGICRDDNGNSFVVGTSSARWGGDKIKNDYAGGKDAFLAKVDAEGNLQWVTFMGSSGEDEGNALYCYGASLYVAGTSSASWGGTKIRRSYSGGKDGFLAKFDANGNLEWNAFLGGGGDDDAKDVFKMYTDWVYVVGSSTAAWGNNPIRTYSAGKDGYLVRTEESGSITWITFMGGAGTDEANKLDITYESPYAVFHVVGSSNASWGSPTDPFLHHGNWDAFYFYQKAGFTLNLFLGGPGNDFGTAIKATNNVYIGGDSDADWGWGAPRRSFTQGKDAFVASLSLSGLSWSTFLGGNGMDTLQLLDVSSLGSGGDIVFPMGTSDASWGAPLPPFTHQGGRDAFAAMLSPSGDMILSGFYGGPGDDELMKAISSGHGSYYVVGSSSATWGAPKRPFSGNTDAFVADLALQLLLDIKRIYLPLVVR